MKDRKRDNMLLNVFKKIYNLSQELEFKRLELEEALVDKFGNLQYTKYEGWISVDEGKVYVPQYAVELDIKNSVSSLYSYGTDYEAYNIEDALLIFFIKYGNDSEQGTDEYYNGYKDIFHEIVREVYEKK